MFDYYLLKPRLGPDPGSTSILKYERGRPVSPGAQGRWQGARKQGHFSPAGRGG